MVVRVHLKAALLPAAPRRRPLARPFEDRRAREDRGRVNAIALAARTRLTENAPGMVGEPMKKTAGGSFDTFDPAHVSLLVAFLAHEVSVTPG